ncbi:MULTISPECIES: sugar ABC transporter substrate-binding protein [unclassified Nocardioides]|uniref:ABC transporter substrate-binding protein n=1 Tax=unclassified Nocardioides TaxID=2615069 RepID=UPI00005718F8|nr:MULTISPECIES: sugar ABC transporter substrate-binding protein [unclassified Nocardioides]ABL83183.1 carbohydrate ABC transporter substrate-binding protein, CUT1 family [Nocardioides sp. JS614]
MKNRTVRRTVAVTAAVAALSLTAACSGGKGAPGSETPSGDGDVSSNVEGTVRVLMEGVPDTDIVEGMIGEFNEQYPNVKVQIETAVYDQMRDKYVASFTAPESSYDLAIIDNPWMGDFAKAGFLTPLDSYIESTSGYDYEDFAEPLRQINEVDGKTYGIPFYNYGLGLIYRTDLLSAAPSTLDELVAAAQENTTDTRAGIAMQPQRGYKAFEEWANFLFAAGGSIYDDEGNLSLDTPEAKEALETYIELYETAAPASSLNWAFDEALRSVSSDKAAMMVSYNWMLPTLNADDSPAGDLAGKFALATMPGGKQVLGSWSWAIPSNSETDDADWAFISWLTSADGEKQRVEAGGAPVRQSVLTDPQVAAQGFGADYYATVGDILANSAPLCQGANCDEMIQAVGTELSAAVSGQKSVADALSAAQEQATRIQSS